MWPKSPRIRKYEQSDNSPRSKKSSPRAPCNKASINSQLKKRRSQGYAPRQKILSIENKQQLTKLPKTVFLTPSSSDQSLSTSLSSSGESVGMVVQPKLAKSPDASPVPAVLSIENKQQLTKLPKTVFLTPSSSDQSLSTSLSSSSESVGMVVQPKLAKPPDASPVPAVLPPYLTLKRQATAAMLNFRARKSVSQMDFKEARRTGNYQLVAHVPNSNALVPAVKSESQLTIKDESLAQLLLQDAAQLCSAQQGNVRFVVNGDQDVRIASLRVFNTIMLRSWRRRREEVRHLSEQVEDFKRSFVKNRNQLHVYNTLFAVEKRRNETLNEQLKQSYMDSAKTKLSYNELNLLLDQVNKEKVQLVQENVQKQQEIDNLQELLMDTKRELFQANAMQREQLEQLTQVQLECQNAKFDIDDLTAQLQSLKTELSQKYAQVEKMRDNISRLAEQLQQSGTRMVEYQCETEIHIGKLMKHAEELEQEIKKKEEQVVTLQNCLAATVGQRIRQCFAQSQPYQHATFRLMHFVAYCMLPGTPPPVLPSTTIPTAVKKIRGLFNSNEIEGSETDQNSAVAVPK